jgi:hypothetical protein
MKNNSSEKTYFRESDAAARRDEGTSSVFDPPPRPLESGATDSKMVLRSKREAKGGLRRTLPVAASDRKRRLPLGDIRRLLVWLSGGGYRH